MKRQPISHSRAVDIVRLYIGREWGEILESVEKGIGAPVIPDVVTFNQKRQTYTICEVKTSKADLQRAPFQLDVARKALIKRSKGVSSFIGITRDLITEFDNDEWKEFLGLMKERGFGALEIYATKVDIVLPALQVTKNRRWARP